MDGGWTHDLWFTRPMPYHLATTPRHFMTPEKRKLQRHVSHSIGIQFRLKNNHSRRISSVGSVVYSNKQTNTMKIMTLRISLASYFHDVNVLIRNNIHMTAYIRQGIWVAKLRLHKAWMGVEPMIVGLRDQRLSTWPPCHWLRSASSLKSTTTKTCLPLQRFNSHFKKSKQNNLFSHISCIQQWTNNQTK